MTSQAISVRRKVSQDVRINRRRFLGYESLTFTCLLNTSQESERGNGVICTTNLQMFVSVLNSVIAFKETPTPIIPMKSEEDKR